MSERSAGFIIFRRQGPQRLYLLLDHGRFWSYPKGHVHKGEDDLAAALRELAEETAIEKIRQVPGFEHEIAYAFTKKHKPVQKRAIYYLAEAPSDAVTISDEHVGFAWLPYDKALARLTYDSTRAVLRAAEKFLAPNAHP